MAADFRDVTVDRRRLVDLNSADILERAAGFAARAMADDTDAYCRAAYLRLAVRYAVLAAQREIEEGRTTRG